MANLAAPSMVGAQSQAARLARIVDTLRPFVLQGRIDKQQKILDSRNTYGRGLMDVWRTPDGQIGCTIRIMGAAARCASRGEKGTTDTIVFFGHCLASRTRIVLENISDPHNAAGRW